MITPTPFSIDSIRGPSFTTMSSLNNIIIYDTASGNRTNEEVISRDNIWFKIYICLFDPSELFMLINRFLREDAGEKKNHLDSVKNFFS